MKISVSHNFLPKQTTSHASVVMDHFGIDFETGQHIIAEDLELPIEQGNIIYFTGASGSGKSSIMREVANQLKNVLNIDEIKLGNQILVDALGLPIQEAMQLLAQCGLGEAQLMLRTPAELSDGQRYRFRLAMALSQKPTWILADEFTAALDRQLAKVIAFNIRRIATRSGIGFLLATTHDDLVEDLAADIQVTSYLDGNIDVQTIKEDSNAEKKNGRSVLQTTSKLPPVPKKTGRTLLGGITEVTKSELCIT